MKTLLYAKWLIMKDNILWKLYRASYVNMCFFSKLYSKHYAKVKRFLGEP